MLVSNNEQQGIYAEEFLFFFMGLRKCHCRHMVGRFKRKYPKDSPVRLAKRLVNAQVALSFTAGVLARWQDGISGSSSTLRIIGIAGRTVVLSRMHVSLILKIALIFGKDIDSKARIPEIIAVIVATVPAILLAGSGKSISSNTDIVEYGVSGAAGGVTAYIIGRAAIKYYKAKERE